MRRALWLAALTVLPGALLCEALGWLVHASLHRLPWRWWRRAHALHHDLAYPVGQFLRPGAYRPTGDRWRFALAGALAATLTVAILPAPLALGLLAEIAAFSIVADRLHDAMHVAGHPLESRAWFRRMRARHFRHHVEDRMNLGIFSHAVDLTLGTFREGTE